MGLANRAEELLIYLASESMLSLLHKEMLEYSLNQFTTVTLQYSQHRGNTDGNMNTSFRHRSPAWPLTPSRSNLHTATAKGHSVVAVFPLYCSADDCHNTDRCLLVEAYALMA